MLTAKAVRAAVDVGVSTLLIAGGGGQLPIARTCRTTLCGSRSDVANPAAPTVYRQRRNDRQLRCAPGCGRGGTLPLDVASDPGLPVVRGQVV